jgi:hypothetical protein
LFLYKAPPILFPHRFLLYLLQVSAPLRAAKLHFTEPRTNLQRKQQIKENTANKIIQPKFYPDLCRVVAGYAKDGTEVTMRCFANKDAGSDDSQRWQQNIVRPEAVTVLLQ